MTNLFFKKFIISLFAILIGILSDISLAIHKINVHFDEINEMNSDYSITVYLHDKSFFKYFILNIPKGDELEKVSNEDKEFLISDEDYEYIKIRFKKRRKLRNYADGIYEKYWDWDNEKNNDFTLKNLKKKDETVDKLEKELRTKLLSFWH